MTVSISLYDPNPIETLRMDTIYIGQVADSYFQADKLQTLIKAAKIDDVEPIWTSLFAKVRMEFQWLQGAGNKC